eukprot:jgi/Astpho2/6781/Aster-x0741
MAVTMEADLLSCSLSDTCAAPSEAQDSNRRVLHLIQQGAYSAALQEDCCVGCLQSAADQAIKGAQAFFAALDSGSVTANHAAAEAQLQTAVAALLLFVQANVTGPAVEVPESPAVLAGIAQPTSEAQQPGLGRAAASADDRWAVAQLSVDGEDPVGLVQLPQYLLLARCLLLKPLGYDMQLHRQEGAVMPAVAGLHSWLWWAARALLLNQRLLGGRAASLKAAVQDCMQQVLDHTGSIQDRRLAAAAHLEAALVAHTYREPQAAADSLTAASSALGVDIQVQGALGKRTVHQVDAKAQLVVRAGTEEPARATEEDSGDEAAELDVAGEGAGGAVQGEMKGLTTDSDVLPAPQLVGEPGVALQGPLGSAQQALLLAMAEQVKRSTSADELQAWQMAPFADALLAQKRSRPMLRLGARLLRARHERGRTRTLERSLVQMQQVVEATEQPQPPVASRMRSAEVQHIVEATEQPQPPVAFPHEVGS